MRKCFVRNCCTVVQEHELRTTTLQSNAKRHFVPQRSHFTLHSHSTLHSSLFTLRTSHFTFRTWHFTLHTSSHLISSHFISFHLIWALLTSSHLISALLISSLLGCHLSSSRLFSSHPSVAQNSHLIEALQLFCTSASFYCQRETLLHTKPLRAERCGWFRYSKIALVIHLQGENSRHVVVSHCPFIGLHHKSGMFRLFPCDASQTKVQIASYNQSQSTVHVGCVQRPKLMGYLCNWGCRDAVDAVARCRSQRLGPSTAFRLLWKTSTRRGQGPGGVPADGVGPLDIQSAWRGESPVDL